MRNDARTVYRDFLAGFAAGLANVALLSPLDTLKTRLMVRDTGNSNIVSLLARIHAQEGFKGLYRGCWVSFVAFPASWSIYFSLFSLYKSQKLFGNNVTLQNIVCSMFAGLGANILTNPLWIVRTRAQLETSENGKYTGILNSIKVIHREEGLAPFVSSLKVSVFGIAHIMIQIPLYEHLKSSRAPAECDLMLILYCSILSKLVASACTYPHEVIRARVFVNPRPGQTVLSLIRQIAAEQGARGFYGGFFPNLYRILPSSFIILYTYEFMRDVTAELQIV